MFIGNTRLVHDHLKTTGKGLTMNDIASHTGLEKKSVKSAINRLDEYGLLARIGKSGACTIYQYSMSPKLTQPVNGKGYTKKELTPFGKPVNAPIKNGTTVGNWIAPMWEPARPEAEAHKLHGSLRNGKVKPWAAPLPMCTGKNGTLQFAPGRLQP